jgi:hypothetical protein
MVPLSLSLSLSGRKSDDFKENASRTTTNASLFGGKKEKREGRVL